MPNKVESKECIGRLPFAFIAVRGRFCALYLNRKFLLELLSKLCYLLYNYEAQNRKAQLKNVHEERRLHTPKTVRKQNERFVTCAAS